MGGCATYQYDMNFNAKCNNIKPHSRLEKEI